MYSIADYGAMIADRVRIDAFARALRHAVKPGSVVIDIGTGTGIFALLACRFGARRVYAIEPDDAIQVAREIAAANGYRDRIEFIQAISTEVTLAERGDVIVSDIGGLLPWFQHHIASIADARRRFLAPGGVLIPRCDTAWAAVVQAPELYEPYTCPWNDNPFGLDMDAARRIVTNTWNKGAVKGEQLLAEPQRWATLDYTVVEDPDACARLSWVVTRPGTAHGLAAGFERTVTDGVCLSNAPDAPPESAPARIYPVAFFPWSAPVALAVGDVVTVDLSARLVGDNYIWSWNTSVLDQGQAGQGKANFTQSTVFGAPLSPVQLHKRAESYVPTPNEDGRITRLVLESMNDGAPLGAIARHVAAEFPSRFRSWQDALSYVGDLSRRYG